MFFIKKKQNNNKIRRRNSNLLTSLKKEKIFWFVFCVTTKVNFISISSLPDEIFKKSLQCKVQRLRHFST